MPKPSLLVCPLTPTEAKAKCPPRPANLHVNSLFPWNYRYFFRTNVLRHMKPEDVYGKPAGTKKLLPNPSTAKPLRSFSPISSTAFANGIEHRQMVLPKAPLLDRRGGTRFLRDG